MLTERTVKTATYEGEGGSQDVRYDRPDGPAGFGVRVYPSGRKSYVVFYRVAGRRRLYTIGSASSLSLKEARDRARRIVQTAKDGIDPLTERQRARNVQTFSDLALVYLEDYARRHKTRGSWRDDARRLGFEWDESSRQFVWIDYDTALPGGRKRKRSAIRDRLGGAKITAIQTADIRALHRDLGEERGPYEANRQQELCRSIFNFAVAEGLLPPDTSNPARAATRTDRAGVKRFREKARDRYVEKHEMRRFGDAVADESDVHVKAAVLLSLLTGARKTEILARRWSDVVEDRGQLHIGYSKGAKLADGRPAPSYKELPDEALDILRALPNAPIGRNGKLVRTDEWIFPSRRRSASGHRVEIRAAWTRIRRKAGLLTDPEDQDEDRRSLTFHDLRRTAGSWLASAGYGDRLIGDILDQRDPRTTARYAHLHPSVKREALADSTGSILAATGFASGSSLLMGESEQEHEVEMSEEQMRYKAEAMLELSELRRQEEQEARFAAIDLFKKIEHLRGTAQSVAADGEN